MICRLGGRVNLALALHAAPAARVSQPCRFIVIAAQTLIGSAMTATTTAISGTNTMSRGFSRRCEKPADRPADHAQTSPSSRASPERPVTM